MLSDSAFAPLFSTAWRVLAAFVLGAMLWAPLLAFASPAVLFSERKGLLFVVLSTAAQRKGTEFTGPVISIPFLCAAVLSNQLGCLLTGLAGRREPVARRSYGFAVLIGVGGMLLAVFLGVAYDQLLHVLPGASAPTIGPWGVVRTLPPADARLLVLVGVTVCPVADEFFFRNGLFRVWADAGAPWLGAVVSSLLFALSRLDFVNFPAYVGLGFLLCAVYHWTGSLLAPWTTHVLLNAAMFLLLFNGYQ